MDRELHARLDDLQRDPYPVYTRARQTEGLTRLAELDAWLVSRDADVREVLRSPEDFSSDNPPHLALRRVTRYRSRNPQVRAIYVSESDHDQRRGWQARPALRPVAGIGPVRGARRMALSLSASMLMPGMKGTMPVGVKVGMPTINVDPFTA